MKKIKLTLVALPLLLLPTVGLGQTAYTWSGAAADGDWNNALNWDASGIPVDTNTGAGNNAGLQISSYSSIVLAGPNLPTLNIPDLGGNVLNNANGNNSTPFVNVKSGGAISLIMGGRQSTYWTNPEGLSRDILTVGDGISGENEDVSVTVSPLVAGTLTLMRHPGSMTHNFTVNSDGTLTFPQAIEFSYGTAAPDRFAKFTIAGGTVDVQGTVTDLKATGNSVNFTTPGGSFTAVYGADFPTITDIENSLGTDFVSSPGVVLTAVDNSGGTFTGTFTVTATESPDPNYWTGIGGSVWDVNTTENFTISQESELVDIDTFANAVSISGQATFADNYFSLDVAQAIPHFNITIDSGGVETGLVDFLNTINPYTVESSDFDGIMGATQVRVGGGGSVTLLGYHSYSGTTTIGAGSTLMIGDGSTDGAIENSVSIANNGAFIFDATEGFGLLYANISGTGSLEKRGGDGLTLIGNTNFTGATIVTEGTLTYEKAGRSATYDIAAGATLDFNINNGGGALIQGGAPTLTGGGTLRFSGNANIQWPVTVATFSLDSGALVDVQGGIFNGSNSTAEIWAGNLSDLNVAAGAVFAGGNGLIEVDAITGDGQITSIVGGSITFGVDDGIGSFAGVMAGAGNRRKVGSGTQTLSGPNTYTGNTIVEEGTLTLEAPGRLTFAPTVDATTNSIYAPVAGTGSVDLNGEMFIDLSATSPADGNYWLLVNSADLTVSYGESFTVNSSKGTFSEVEEGEWELSEGPSVWTYIESTGELSVATEPGYTFWLSGYPNLSDSTPEGDPDKDGIVNLLEYVLNGDPELSDLGILPTISSLTGTTVTFTFNRLAISEFDTLQVFEVGSDLLGWTQYYISAPADPLISIGEAVDGVEVVTVTIPTSQAIDGKLFGRLVVEDQ